MTSDEFQSIMENATYPLTLKTTGGHTYEIRSAHAYWVPDDYPNLMVLAIPNRGVTWFKLAAIESIEVEHVAASR
jgi:hypothetical protein